MKIGCPAQGSRATSVCRKISRGPMALSQNTLGIGIQSGLYLSFGRCWRHSTPFRLSFQVIRAGLSGIQAFSGALRTSRPVSTPSDLRPNLEISNQAMKFNCTRRTSKGENILNRLLHEPMVFRSWLPLIPIPSILNPLRKISLFALQETTLGQLFR